MSLSTIDAATMNEATTAVILAAQGIPLIHTVTITLNGAHGGADVIITGHTSDELDEEATVTVVVS